MKFAAVLRFELAYQLRRAWPWLIFTALLGISFLLTRDGSLSEALRDEFFVNSPFAIAKVFVVGCLLWLLLGAAVAGEAAARDVATGTYPLTYTLPVGKATYLGGRFAAALILNLAILLAIPAAILLAVYLPGVERGLIGPFRPAAYLTAFAYVALPNAFVTTAVQFAVAVRTGRPLTAYLGSVLLFASSFILGLFLFVQGRQDLARIFDPVGVHFILSDLSHFWTTYEKSWRLLTLEGTLLVNRLLWIGIGIATLFVTHATFRLAHRSGRGRWLRWRGARRADAPGESSHAVLPAAAPVASRDFGTGMRTRQVAATAWASFRAMAGSWTGRAMLVGIPLLMIPVLLDQLILDGVPLVPETSQVIKELVSPLSAEMSRWVIVPLLLAFFAGELVWHERDAGLGELADTMPRPDWVPLLGKLIGLGLLLTVFVTMLGAAGVAAQLIRGHHEIEPWLYVTALFGLQLPEFLLFAVLVLAVHAVVDQKHVGHLVAMLLYVGIALAPMLGLEHNLLIYGASPAWMYTELRGFGPTLAPWLWFKLYWSAWALLLLVAARLLWVRGRDDHWAARLRQVRLRLTGATLRAAVTAAVLIVALGGFVFYNTNVVNEYRNSSDVAARSAEYERRYGRFDGVPQPSVLSTRLNVEIHPARRTADIRGTYLLVNLGAEPVDSIHLATMPGVETGDIEFSRPASVVLDDTELDHQVHALAEPLAPGDSVTLRFSVRFRPRGFTEQAADPAVTANATFFGSSWMPMVGYQASRELMGASARREHGLVPQPLIASLYDTGARARREPGTAFEAVIGTALDQVAVAPGALRRSWTEGDRRYFHYVTDAPVGSEYVMASARYAVHEARWSDSTGAAQDVGIRIYHNPRHRAHLDRTVRSILGSLDYYTREFGPYPYGHLSVVERPPGGTGMHADPGLITHGEGFPLFDPGDDPSDLDLPFAVVAHEMGHQWGVPYAVVEGAPVLAEGVAWYYGMKLVEHERGIGQLRRLLRFMRQPYVYPPIRRGEPLLRGLDPYMAYRRGPFALYALSVYMGDDRVHAALRRLRDMHAPAEAPPATMLDLHRELQAVTPDSLQPLLHDLFEVNTFWNLETEAASAERMDGGRWRVTLAVRARKQVYDSAGVESEVPMDEWVDIGVFARPAPGADELAAPLHLERHRIRSGRQAITVTVPGEPSLAGIDPHHVLDWEEGEDDDNIEQVTLPD